MEQTLRWVNTDSTIRAKLFDKFNDRLEGFDIYHCFGLSPDNAGIVKLAKNKGLNYVCSPVYWEPWELSRHTQSWTRRLMSRAVHAVARNFRSYEWMHSVAPGQFLLDSADSILPNSLAEVDSLKRNFIIDNRKVRVIPNGVEPTFSDGNEIEFKSRYGYEDFILYVGRIEPRKNLVRLAEAADALGMELVLIGSSAGNDAYLERCVSRNRGRTHHIGTIDHKSSMLKSAYKSASVFVLPSWFETPGISAMEAAVSGCPVVVTSRGSTREYFGEYVEYCDPASVSSICAAIENASTKENVGKLRDSILDNYSWQRIGEMIVNTYKGLNRRGTCR